MPISFGTLSIRYLTITIWCISLIAISSLFLPHLAKAGSFKVIPVKLFLDAGSKTAVIRISNLDDDSLTVQLNAKKWMQDKNGLDQYEDTRDIVFFPKIVTIDREEERIIRIGYQGKMKTASEQTYRLFLEELPVIKPGEMALKFALTMGVPIFIKPTKEINRPSIGSLTFSGGLLNVEIKNGGNKHFIVGDIVATGLSGQGREVFKTTGKGWYVLAGMAKVFKVNIPEPDCKKAYKLGVTVEVDKTLMRGDLVLDKTQCTNKKKDEKGPGDRSGK